MGQRKQTLHCVHCEYRGREGGTVEGDHCISYCLSLRELGSAPQLAVSLTIHLTIMEACPEWVFLAVPDFRSGMDTVLETGPGAWELRAKGQYRDSSKYKVTSTMKAIPTQTHMSLVQLHKVCMC